MTKWYVSVHREWYVRMSTLITSHPPPLPRSFHHKFWRAGLNMRMLLQHENALSGAEREKVRRAWRAL
jgi:hypothetical protein